jgi:PIN domain nuclease of toxin-antitoxin system
MKPLLDSQILYWSFHLPEGVQTRTRAVAADRANELWYSAVTQWELAIKRAKVLLRFEDAALLAAVAAFGLQELQIAARHGLAAAALPLHHRDPFDRLLVAQAKLENLTLVTTDRTLRRFEVTVLEA